MQIHTQTPQSGSANFGQDHNANKQNFARPDRSHEENRTAPRRFTQSSPKSQTQNALAHAQNKSQNPTENIQFQTSLTDATANTASAQPPAGNKSADAYSFGDVIDIINPLHHIPIVNSLYRGISGDEIKPASQIIGSAIFSGPIGAATSVINTVIEHETGRDITGNAIALVSGEGITRMNHDASDITFDYQKSFEDDIRTALTNGEKSQAIYNFNNANNAYSHRAEYAARYNS